MRQPPIDLRAAFYLLLALLLSGCVPIGVRVQNMLAMLTLWQG